MTDTSADTAVAAAEHRSPDAPALVVPEGWVVDGVARERLLHQLADAPAGVAGVLAESSELPPGTSFRVHAERMACAPLAVAAETRTGRLRGVALLRPGVPYDVVDDEIEVGDGALLVDPGAHAHDPWQAPDPVLPASPAGRPPFPWRPVVVFLATEPDDETADWARALVNGLVRSDVEARLAMAEPAEGLHLTRPCLPVEESLRALAPDVVVVLDPGAHEMVASSSSAKRTLVVIESLADVAATSELVSWRRGRASGRVRARIGRRIDPATLASLIRRLCAGPHPIAAADRLEGPIHTWSPGVESRALHRARAGAGTVTVITGGQRANARVDGLIEHLFACGMEVAVVPIRRAALEVEGSADIVWVDATVRSELPAELATSRVGTRPRVVVDLDVHDLAGTGAKAQPALTPTAARLVEAADAVTSAAPAVHTAAGRATRRAQLLPTLLTHARALDLRRLRDHTEGRGQRLVGWSVGSAGSSPMVLGAVAASLLELLDADPELRVEIVGNDELVPPAVLGHHRVTVVTDEHAARRGEWVVHVWTPDFAGDEIASDALPLLEASCAAVPTVVTARLRPSIDGPLSRDLQVDEEEVPGSWSRRLQPLLQERHRWERRSAEAARRADALYGPESAEAVANRFIGWTRFEGS